MDHIAYITISHGSNSLHYHQSWVNSLHYNQSWVK